MLGPEKPPLPSTRPPSGAVMLGTWLAGRSLLILAVVSVVFLGLGLRQAWSDAPTYDEPVYLAAGVTALVHHDLRLNPEHPPLGKVLAALPVLADHPIVPEGPAWASADEAVYSTSFVQAQQHAGKLRTEMFLVRLVPLLEAVAIGFAVMALASGLFGRGAGLLAGVLWLANPFTLGLGHLDGVDIPFTLATVLTSWALLDALRSTGRRQLLVLGAACAAAVLTQEDGVLVAVSAGVVMVAAGWRSSGLRSLLRLVPVAVTAWVLVWLCYAAIAPSSVMHVAILPEPYLTGLRYLASHDTIPGPAYLVGTYWVGGRWWYWPVSLAVKVPLLTVAVLIVGPLALRLARRSVRHEAVAVAVLPAVLLTAFTVVEPKDVGLRYLLPVIALWLVVASAAALAARRVTVQAALAVVVVVAAAMTVASAPSSLAWVNPGFGPAYQVTSNSDVDWGQGFWLLRSWAAGKHHPWIAYFGQGLGVADIPGARSMLTEEPGTAPSLRVDPRHVVGWVAVSATALTSNNFVQLGWLRAYCPVATLGGSILVYRFEAPPVVGPGPTVPAPTCAGEASHLVGRR